MNRVFVSILRILLLTAALASAGVQAQPSLDAAAARQREIAAQIERVQSEFGPSAAELIEPLSALALFYEENGDDVLAVATTERVLAVIRTNFGLHSLEQVPMTLRLIEGAEVRGDIATAWNLEQRLIAMAERNPHDLRSVAIWNHFGDLRIDMLDRYARGELPARMSFGCYHENPRVSWTGCLAGSRRDAARAVLNEAHQYYTNAINVLRRNEQYASDELVDLEMSLVTSSYKYGRFFEGSVGCDRGLDSLTRLNEYQNQVSAALVDRVDSLVQIADGLLVCQQNGAALGAYQQAYELAVQEGLEAEAMARIFAPQSPVLLPTFLPVPLVVAESQSAAGSVEVAFEVTRYGLTRGVRVLSDRKNEVASDVRREVRRRRFRPVIFDGEISVSPRFVVRYALAD